MAEVKQNTPPRREDDLCRISVSNGIKNNFVQVSHVYRLSIPNLSD
jgi:hypothetical protein